MTESPGGWVAPDAPISSVIGVNIEETCRIEFELLDDATLVEWDDMVTNLAVTFTDQALIKSTLVLCRAVRVMLRARGLPIPEELGREST